MGTVFAVLIFLAFLISLLKYIPMILDKLTKKPAPAVEAPKAAPVAEEVVVDETDDLELIAVITAAIAAQEGTSTDGFVVRSIRRRPSNNWN
jgi:sodium pump decarboxylase gamma subunit